MRFSRWGLLGGLFAAVLGIFALTNLWSVRGSKHILIHSRPLDWSMADAFIIYHQMFYQLFGQSLIEPGRDGQVYSGLIERWHIDHVANRVDFEINASHPLFSMEGAPRLESLPSMIFERLRTEDSSIGAQIIRPLDMRLESVSKTETGIKFSLRFKQIYPFLLQTLARPSFAIFPPKDLIMKGISYGPYRVVSAKKLQNDCDMIQTESKATGAKVRFDVCFEADHIRELLSKHEVDALLSPTVKEGEFQTKLEKIDIGSTGFLIGGFNTETMSSLTPETRRTIGCRIWKALGRWAQKSGSGITSLSHLLPPEYLSPDALKSPACTSEIASQTANWPTGMKLRLPFNNQLFPPYLKDLLIEELKLPEVEFVDSAFKKPQSVDVMFSEASTIIPDPGLATLIFHDNSFWWMHYCGQESFLRLLADAGKIHESKKRIDAFTTVTNSISESGCAFPLLLLPTTIYAKDTKTIKKTKFRQEFLLIDMLGL